MKKAAVLLTLLTFALAVPMFADDDDRHQSYLSYDDGGTIVRSGEDGREIEAHRNLPIYPGDEVVTTRRGRAEVRLSDGNIIGIDRASSLRFLSMVDAYDGDSKETVVELKYGKVGVHRTDIGRDHVRLDTPSASYVAENEGVYAVETDPDGRDRVTVFDGTLEVRTRTRATRLREGESANVDDRGVYDLIGDQRTSADDFERWFLQRAERFGTYKSKYMDRRLSYWSGDLDEHGQWVFVTGIGWSWRPYVAVGWRPYYNGYWYNRGGCLTWVSYDPWGWGTYHYGRWAFDPGYGWVWVPGYGYSPAWVYWMYGSDYIGWAPAGWWDCYRPYYSWAYNPYRNYGHRYGYGFYGRVRTGDLDLRPWTFVDSRGVIVSTRVDRAALTADAVKQRLGRNRDGFAAVGYGSPRFTRKEWNDPADAVRRRGLDGGHTGAESGAGGVGVADMTPFFRRDGNVSGDVRDRVARSRGGSGSSSAPSHAGGSPSSPSSTPSRGLGGTDSVAPIGRGGVAPIGRGSVAPIDGGGRVGRGGSTTTPPTTSQPADSGTNTGGISRRGRDTETPGETPRQSGPSWRDRERGKNRDTAPSGSGSNDSWRNRVPERGGERRDTPSSGSGSSTSSGSSEAPSRRVIDSVGGVRIRPRESGDSGSSASSGRSERSSGGSSVDRGSRSSSGSSGSSNGGGGSSARSHDGGGSRSSGGSSSARSSDGGGSSSRGNSDGGGRSSGNNGGGGGGRAKRD